MKEKRKAKDAVLMMTVSDNNLRYMKVGRKRVDRRKMGGGGQITSRMKRNNGKLCTGVLRDLETVKLGRGVVRANKTRRARNGSTD